MIRYHFRPSRLFPRTFLPASSLTGTRRAFCLRATPFLCGPSTMSGANPLLTPSALPYKCPPFADIRVEHYAPAFDAALAEHVKELEAIRACDDPPTFHNTVEALEAAGRQLGSVTRVFMNVNAADTTEEMQKLESDFSVRLAQHRDGIYLDPVLFARVRAVYEDRAALAGEEARLAEETYRDFRHAGAALDDGKKAELRGINEALARLSTDFSHRLLAGRATSAVVVADAALLDGLSADEIEQAREAYAKAAAERGEADAGGKYALVLTNTTQQPVMARLTRPEMRARVLAASLGRAEAGDAGDTTAIAQEMARLRIRKAALMGKRCFSDWALENQMADTDSAGALLRQLIAVSGAAATEEAAALRQLAAEEDGAAPDAALAAADWTFYAERLRKKRYELDEEELKPYFELRSVLERGVFYTAEQLYGLRFSPRPDIAAYHPDVLVYEVFEESGEPLALYMLDPFARPSKRGGAWMSCFVEQSHFFDQKPVVYNVCNFVKPPEGKPALLTQDNVTTLFHEFGHGLHGMLSGVKYESLSGTSVSRDFVELPSQVNEHWAMHGPVLRHYAHHHATGDVIPEALVERMVAAAHFNQGFETLEVVKAAAIDLHWHTRESADAIPATLAELEEEALSAYDAGVPEVPPRYRSGYFLHIFGGGYSSNYYSYMWAKVLDCDAFEWFLEQGGLTRDAGQHFRRTVLSRGNTADPNGLYTDFAGRTPDVKPFLRDRGLLQYLKQ